MELDRWRVDSDENGWKKIPQNGGELNPWSQKNQYIVDFSVKGNDVLHFRT
jgi:hypothetical protein